MTARIQPRRPHIGLWGTFDVENYGDVLFARIARRELGRRLPEMDLRVFAPLGHLRPTRLDPGEPVEPLGPWHPERLSQLAGLLDCVVVGGGDLIHTEDSAYAAFYGVSPASAQELAPSRWFVDGFGPGHEECRVMWHAVGVPRPFAGHAAERVRRAMASLAYVSVRDEVSRRALEATGSDREIVVVPDSAVLLPRVFTRDAIEQRVRHLRVMGWYPPEGEPLVVQGSRNLVPVASDLAGALTSVREGDRLAVVIAELGGCHGDAVFGDALQPLLAPPVYRLPAVSVEDLTAAIAGAASFVGSSLHGNIAAFAFGRAHAMLNVDGLAKLDGFAQLIGDSRRVARRPEEVPEALARRVPGEQQEQVRRRLERHVDAHFDRLAEIARRAARERPGGRRLSVEEEIRDLRRRLLALREAHAARGRELVAEAALFAERNEELLRHVVGLEERARVLEGELQALLQTRTFRYSAPFREAYGRVRRWMRRG